MAKLEQKLTPPTAELLVAALTSGDTRMATAFRQTLDRAARRNHSRRSEELEALQGLLGAFVSTAEAGSRTALEPTLRHLLARVL
ncbi:MAG: hypothetical protein O3A53_01195 [Acidobacteria bacterium]|nr:hypothetical protein [Acidobacteriota bacterium]MDA1233396.1 hypothetical protein [Acidobacteriota bacterium]